ncbi:acyl-CoA carboxylase subunit beta [Nakamurella lactea]|uniref:acyl-CoA carboxylase subunit beta n=1 Tax=Nakamurella lactea TaxID=459515 RepID=UPI000429228D|nr:carboxyl transferase domain-containing protein [Nakamurella lactea]
MAAGLPVTDEWHRSIGDGARADAVAAVHARDRLTARERIALLCDEGSFTEIGGLVRDPVVGERAPADGVVTGSARIDGRPALVLSQDYSVFGGSVGHLGGAKTARLIDIALRDGCPLVMLLDGGGHRIQDGQNSRDYANAGNLFAQLARLSGYAPIVAAVLGPGFAANTNFAALADFVVMRSGHGTMGIAGPALVAAATGEQLTSQQLGGTEVQVDRQGLADLAVDGEQECLDALRTFLGLLPGNATQPTPAAPADPADDDPARGLPLRELVPDSSRRMYDIRPAVQAIADAGSVFELKPTFARNLVSALVRVRGRTVGVIANQPLHKGGMLDANACEKAAHFIGLCDAYGIALVFLMDVPGFAIGSAAEASTLGRRSAKMLFELGHATVPRLSIVLRKGYGLGYVAMSGSQAFSGDACLAWPTAEICAMSVEGSVDVAYRKDYQRAADPDARRAELIEQIRAQVGPLQAAAGFGVDDVIDPAETRARIVEVLDRAPTRRRLPMPPKVRGISPI